jgi:hypothetical protein
LYLKCDILVTNFALKCSLYRYNTDIGKEYFLSGDKRVEEITSVVVRERFK